MSQSQSRLGPAQALVTAVCALSLLACSADEGANDARRCENDPQCDGGRCYRGYCIAGGTSDAGVDASLVDAGHDAGRDGGLPAEPCDTEGEEDFCYTGPMETSLVGRCAPGTKVCSDGFWSACAGEVKPAAGEICNAVDDDCDRAVDEDAELGSCDTMMLGACAQGSLVCDEAGAAVCEQMVVPGSETCNGNDDDCDGATDEGDVAQASCYQHMTGCVDSNDDGVFECSGICTAGVRECIDGRMQDCEGQTAPATDEDCDLPAGGALPIDEDCDGEVDEGCSCTAGAMRDCYSGPQGTAGVGECELGTQACTGGVWGPCTSQIVPVPETCMNLGADDDCNGETDDIPMRGTACTDDAQMGRCRSGTRECESGMLACVTPEPRAETCDSTDDDCAGGVDEGFDLFTDEQNCGACGEACDEGGTCCGGACFDTETSETHCGACGTVCDMDQTCCGGGCFDTASSEQHCGMCGIACPPGQTCCGGTCYNLDSDNDHCGTCTTACGAATGCCDGSCRLLSLGC